MKQMILVVFACVLGRSGQAQEVLTMPVAPFPQHADTAQSSRELYVFASMSYILPYNDDTPNEFQTKRLGGDPKSPARIFRARAELLVFAPSDHERMFEPHGFVRLDVFPMHYISTRVGLGVSWRKHGLSGGLFTGNYFRRVASDGNFVTRRSRQFDQYPLTGAYVQVVGKHGSFFGSIAREERKYVFGLRAALRLGNSAGLQNGLLRLGTIELVTTREEFAGTGIGVSIEVVPKIRLEVLGVVPAKNDRNDQARLGTNLKSGVLISTACYLD